MGRIRKHKLSWKPLGSSLIAGYRLYWSKGNPVSYSSTFIDLGNKTELYLPDILLDVVPSGASVYLGISAVDKVGNESDIILLPECYNLKVPLAPVQLILTTLDVYKIIEPKEKANNQIQDSQILNTPQSNQKTQTNYISPEPIIETIAAEIIEDFNF